MRSPYIVSRNYDWLWFLSMPMLSLAIGVLVSGAGTNLQALLDAQARGELAPAVIAVVISNRPGVPALERAIKSPAVAARLKPLGILPDYAPPAKLLAEMRDEHKRVSELARQEGLVK